MSWRWVDHTAEVELAVDAADAAAVVSDAVAATGELLGGIPAGPRGTHAVEAEAPDRAGQLAILLEELVFLGESEGFVPTGARDVVLDEGRLAATIDGAFGEPRPLVKAVTYHRLAFEPMVGGGWRASVTFDV